MKTSKGTILLASGVFVVGAGVGGLGTYTYLKENGKLLVKAENVDPPEVENITKRDTSLPSDTLSPTLVIKEVDKYTDKEVKLRGFLIQVSDNNYTIAGQEEKDPGALSVDFAGSNVDPKQYVSFYTNQQQSQQNGGTNQPVTLKGKIVNEGGKLKLTVTSIEK